MALTELEKRAIQHCVNRLKEVDTQNIFSFIWNNRLIAGTDEEKRAFFNTLSAKMQEQVNSQVSDVTEWLNTLKK